MTTRNLVFLALISLALLVAYALLPHDPALGCPLFQDPLRDTDLTNLDRLAIEPWIMDTYRIPKERVSLGEHIGAMTHSAYWEAGGKGHVISFEGDKARQMDLIWHRRTPTLEEVVTCLGKPQGYGAYLVPGVEVPSFELELWYPDQGLMVSMVRFPRFFELPGSWPPTVTEGLRMERMTLVQPGALADVVRDAYFPRRAKVIADAVAAIQPWPDDLADIQIITEVER